MTKQERSWVIQDWANSAYSLAITTAILPIYFKDVVSKGIDSSLSTAYWGYTNSIATFLIAILAPILGSIADYKGYKKKLFNFFLFMGVLCTGGLYFVREGNWVLCIIIYALSAIGYSGSNIFYDAFLVDVTEESRMDWISSLGFGFGYIGSTIPFILSIIIIKKPSIIGLGSVTEATRFAFLITAAWWLIFSIPIIKNTKQKYYIQPEKQFVKKSFLRVWKTLKNTSKYKNIFIFLIAYFFYIDGVGTIVKMSTVYGRDVGISGADLLIILLVVQFVAFPCAIIYGKLAEKFSVKVMLFIGIGTYFAISIYAIFVTTIAGYWIMAMMVASAQGGIQALSRSLFGKIIPKENSSEFFGLYNIFGRFSAIFGPLLIAVVSQITGNSKLGILSMFILFGIGGFFLIKVEENPLKA